MDGDNGALKDVVADNQRHRVTNADVWPIVGRAKLVTAERWHFVAEALVVPVAIRVRTVPWALDDDRCLIGKRFTKLQAKERCWLRPQRSLLGGRRQGRWWALLRLCTRGSRNRCEEC